MALRSAQGLTLGVGRLLPALNLQLSRELHAFAAPSREEQSADGPCQGPAQLQQYVREQANAAVYGKLGLGFAAQMLGGKDEQAQRGAPQPAVPALAAAVRACGSRAGPMLPSRAAARRPLLPGMARAMGRPQGLSLVSIGGGRGATRRRPRAMRAGPASELSSG
ncbi:hypothetical protein TSOC_006704 [Tetrabaena socialis]|uniref:Uncharacterized protein n=1 Tax=Tetrabaena socialis TaxID=47790 RepID=A0A2J8A2Y4_9CHLO|nr:hypothetical protein TSOC_006704 [Tetrabaena socialis]|eukprot:PNH06879.1 hypothetical protein TSOC_006704 [Tetrabaena socialis]